MLFVTAAAPTMKWAFSLPPSSVMVYIRLIFCLHSWILDFMTIHLHVKEHYVVSDQEVYCLKVLYYYLHHLFHFYSCSASFHFFFKLHVFRVCEYGNLADEVSTSQHVKYHMPLPSHLRSETVHPCTLPVYIYSQ